MSIHKFGFAALAVVLMASLAQAQHTDIEIEVEAGMLATDPRVGEGEFGEAPNPANVADEPGIEADDGVLMPGDVIGFNAVDILGSNLWYWDGTGPVNFGASPTNLTIEHPVTNATAVLDSADSGGVGGFTIGAADALGGLHQDLDFVLGNMTPPAGIYLFGMELTSPSYDTSEPLYMVLGSGLGEPELDAAVDWVNNNLVPEPTSWLLALLGFMAVRKRFS